MIRSSRFDILLTTAILVLSARSTKHRLSHHIRPVEHAPGTVVQYSSVPLPASEHPTPATPPFFYPTHARRHLVDIAAHGLSHGANALQHHV